MRHQHLCSERRTDFADNNAPTPRSPQNFPTNFADMPQNINKRLRSDQEETVHKSRRRDSFVQSPPMAASTQSWRNCDALDLDTSPPGQAAHLYNRPCGLVSVKKSFINLIEGAELSHIGNEYIHRDNIVKCATGRRQDLLDVFREPGPSVRGIHRPQAHPYRASSPVDHSRTPTIPP